MLSSRCFSPVSIGPQAYFFRRKKRSRKTTHVQIVRSSAPVNGLGSACLSSAAWAKRAQQRARRDRPSRTTSHRNMTTSPSAFQALSGDPPRDALEGWGLAVDEDAHQQAEEGRAFEERADDDGGRLD